MNKSNGNAVVKNRTYIRRIVTIAILGAVASVLMLINFNVPLMPSFIKLDFSELPALIASFSLGPLSGVVVCLIKNLVNLTTSSTMGIGELSNFILGACFVIPAGLIYKRNRNIKGAVAGALTGCVLMAVLSLFTNYYIVYPIYTNFMPLDTILDMYKTINPSIENLWQALMIFNVPFTFIKGLLNAIITFLIYKKLSPVLTGRK